MKVNRVHGKITRLYAKMLKNEQSDILRNEQSSLERGMITVGKCGGDTCDRNRYPVIVVGWVSILLLLLLVLFLGGMPAFITP